MKKTVFKEYDIRGKVGQDFIVEEVYAVGQAIASYFLTKNKLCKKIIVAMDGRSHSEDIKNNISRAFQDSGLDVVFIGVAPTPVLYFMLQSAYSDAGVMITASHNGPDYNGLKICLGKESVSGPEIQEIYKLYSNKKQVAAATQGSYAEINAHEIYLDWLTEHFAHLKNCDLAIVLDCANGTVGTVMPELVKRLNWSHATLLYDTVDAFPKHSADPTIEHNMLDLKKKVTEEKAALGIGFDGDGDRMAAVTDKGKLLLGDILLALFSKNILKNYPQATIVYDVKCSQIVPELITEWGGIAHIAPSGHSIIKNNIKVHKALLAGELSGHFFFNDNYFGYDDGVYAALRLIEILSQTTMSLEELIRDFPTTYATAELRIECPEEQKKSIIMACERYYAAKKDISISRIDGLRIVTPDGWGIIRASNTQPVMSIRCESYDLDALERIKHDFCEALGSSFTADILNNSFFKSK